MLPSLPYLWRVLPTTFLKARFRAKLNKGVFKNIIPCKLNRSSIKRTISNVLNHGNLRIYPVLTNKVNSMHVHDLADFLVGVFSRRFYFKGKLPDYSSDFFSSDYNPHTDRSTF